MLIETKDLDGPAIDWAVGKANGWIDYPEDSIEQGSLWHLEPAKAPFDKTLLKSHFSPSTDWAQGGPIIEREKMAIMLCESVGDWLADLSGTYKVFTASGPTPLVAAMRCYVTSKLGPVIDLPDEFAPPRKSHSGPSL